ncbi:MAG: hypothetical protein Q7T96_04290 [Methylobacter sp.]|nr:hypothetical protein [Methylobacter sp.]
MQKYLLSEGINRLFDFCCKSGSTELSADLAQALRQLREQEKIFDAYSFILPLSPLPDTEWQGHAVDNNGKTVNVSYSCQQGLLVGREIELFAGDNKV